MREMSNNLQPCLICQGPSSLVTNYLHFLKCQNMLLSSKDFLKSYQIIVSCSGSRILSSKWLQVRMRLPGCAFPSTSPHGLPLSQKPCELMRYLTLSHIHPTNIDAIAQDNYIQHSISWDQRENRNHHQSLHFIQVLKYN